MRTCTKKTYVENKTLCSADNKPKVYVWVAFGEGMAMPETRKECFM